MHMWITIKDYLIRMWMLGLYNNRPIDPHKYLKSYVYQFGCRIARKFDKEFNLIVDIQSTNC